MVRFLADESCDYAVVRTLTGMGHEVLAVAKDIARVCEIWRQCRDRCGTGGDFLFGAFGAVDAMFAPVVTRLDTYGVDLDDTCAAYTRAVLSLPAFDEWRDAARQEPWVLAEEEVE